MTTAAIKRSAPYALLGVLLLALPVIIPSGYVVRVINTTMLYSIVAIGVNLIGGYGGQLAMGHACYVGIGAYTQAILTVHHGWPFLPSFFTALLFTTLYGLITGIICLGRIKGDYLMIVTMGVSEITRIVFQNWVSLTGGPMGIPQVPSIRVFGFVFKNNTRYYYLFLGFLILTIIVVRRIVKSRFGRAVIAIRDDEVAARAMGINTVRHKIITFTISTGFAGLAGIFLAHYTRFVGPMQYNLDEGLLYFQMIIIGGLGSVSGSILGAAILVLIPELFRSVYEYRLIVYGSAMILMMIVKPEGLLGNAGPNHILVRFSRNLKNALSLGGGRAGSGGTNR
ncbi:MAG: branched-chain amino acid ABC transporter permease [Spirochaetaceae bacterium]|jgi:branched-chain amino acid transport system permease protein|nr:branched-chain amino acid ABC transporter permease [Spirochaetaceae bacterium]